MSQILILPKLEIIIRHGHQFEIKVAKQALSQFPLIWASFIKQLSTWVLYNTALGYYESFPTQLNPWPDPLSHLLITLGIDSSKASKSCTNVSSCILFLHHCFPNSKSFPWVSGYDDPITGLIT